MEISIGSYKFRLEILVLIVLVSWILFGHLLCSCSRVGLKEGLEMVSDAVKETTAEIKADVPIFDELRKKHNVSKSETDVDDSDKKEGFIGANNMASGPEFAGAHTPDYIMNPSAWSMPTLTYSPGTTPDAGVQAIWDRPKQPVPLPEGQLDMFATTEFKPECCPSAFSSSMGCACLTTDQYGFLKSRGYNNVPFDQY